jgi:hypothetical protein
MAAFTSKQYANSPAAFVGPASANMMAFYWEVSITSNAAQNDTLTFGTVPKGFRVFGGCLESTDLDTGGSPTITFDIGDAGDVDRLFDGSTAGQTAAADRALAVTGQHHLYTADTVITGLIPTAVATGTTGTVSLSLYGRFEGPTS